MGSQKRDGSDSDQAPHCPGSIFKMVHGRICPFLPSYNWEEIQSISAARSHIAYYPTSYENLLTLAKEQLPETAGSGIYHYKESSLESALGIVATVVASILPVCSVVALYVIQSNNLRLGMLAIFSTIFSLTLALMTNARRIEVFAATAA